MTLSSPLNPSQNRQSDIKIDRHKTLVFFSRLVRLALFFAYSTFPMWTSWYINQAGYYIITPEDMLLALAWLPISAAITGLSFMKFGWKKKIQGTISFLVLNAIVAGTLIYFIPL